MRIKLPFGRHSLEIELPAHAEPTAIAKPVQPGVADSSAAVREALNNPVQAHPLAKIARGRRSACILICDITRPVPNHLFLRPMIEDMTASGIPLDAITVLVATGLHRPN